MNTTVISPTRRSLVHGWRSHHRILVDSPNLAALLGYLRTCVTTVVIDFARTQTAQERIPHKLEGGAIATPDQIVVEKIGRAALGQIVNRLAATSRERIVLYDSFTLDLPPRAILVRHPDLFAEYHDHLPGQT